MNIESPTYFLYRMIFLQLPLSLLLPCSIPDASYPSDSLLSTVNSVLCGTYKPDAELMNGSLQLLQRIREVLVVSSPSNVLCILEALRTGLQLWIEDKAEVLAEDVFNSVVCRVFVSSVEFLTLYRSCHYTRTPSLFWNDIPSASTFCVQWNFFWLLGFLA